MEAKTDYWIPPMYLKVEILNHPDKELQCMAALDYIMKYFLKADQPASCEDIAKIIRVSNWLNEKYGIPSSIS